MRGAESTSLSQQTPESRHITSAICFDSLLASACGGHSPNLTHGPVLPCTLFKLKFDSSLKKKKKMPLPQSHGIPRNRQVESVRHSLQPALPRGGRQGISGRDAHQHGLCPQYSPHRGRSGTGIAETWD